MAGLSLVLLMVGASAPAQAKGCIKGALIGGRPGISLATTALLARSRAAPLDIMKPTGESGRRPTRPNRATDNTAQTARPPNETIGSAAEYSLAKTDYLRMQLSINKAFSANLDPR